MVLEIVLVLHPATHCFNLSALMSVVLRNVSFLMAPDRCDVFFLPHLLCVFSGHLSHILQVHYYTLPKSVSPLLHFISY